jgi:hypothetical protein
VPSQLDPATIASLTAALVARCEFGEFSVTATPTSLVFPPITPRADICPVQANCVVIQGQPRVLVEWSARFRQHVYGEKVVIAQSLQAYAVAMMTVRANTVLDLLDLQAPINVARPGGKLSDGGFPGP